MSAPYGDDALFALPLPVTRRSYLIESLGYPLPVWLDVLVDESEVDTDIVQIDLYADEARSLLLVDGLGLDDFTEEQQLDISHALHSRQCSDADCAAFAAKIDRIQASLR